ncbi:hypothetical protein KCP77_03705 [Salmonella enterica subsp. enterica]|nr:hypothetical protein KCP77_03705 [Salmonella enterica subsp. enterica]
MSRACGNMGLTNYWGYNPWRCSTRCIPHGPVRPRRRWTSFRDAVKALHRAGFGGHSGHRIKP